MSGKKISELTEEVAPPTDAFVPVVSGGTTYKVKIENLPIEGLPGPEESSNNEVVLFDGTEGAAVKRSSFIVNYSVANGEQLVNTATSYLVDVAALAQVPTITIAGAFPEGTAVQAVTARVVTALEDGDPSDPSGFHIGDGTIANAFGDSIATSAGTTTSFADYTISNSYFIYTEEDDLVLTAVGNDFNSKGSIRVTVFTQRVVPATS